MIENITREVNWSMTATLQIGNVFGIWRKIVRITILSTSMDVSTILGLDRFRETNEKCTALIKTADYSDITTMSQGDRSSQTKA